MRSSTSNPVVPAGFVGVALIGLLDPAGVEAVPIESELAGVAETSVEVDGLGSRTESDPIFHSDSLSPLADESFPEDPQLAPGAEAAAVAFPGGPDFTPVVRSRSQVWFIAGGRGDNDATSASATATALTLWEPVSSAVVLGGSPLPDGTPIDATLQLSFDGSLLLNDDSGFTGARAGAGATASADLRFFGSPDVENLYSAGLQIEQENLGGGDFAFLTAQPTGNPWATDFSIDDSVFGEVTVTVSSMEEIGFEARIGEPLALQVSLSTAVSTNGIANEVQALSDFFGTGLYQLTSSTPGVSFVPIAPSTASVPEPSSLALLSLGGLSLAGWRQRRRRRKTLPAGVPARAA